MPDIPDTIGPYQVLRPIAQGGMAEVFEVRDPDSGERRACKLLMELKTSVKRFNREFEAMTRLNHPNIVRVFRYGFHGKHPWMSMELLRGDPLQVRVKGFGPPGTPERTAEVLRIGWFVANALQYIHDRGLVHRDLKSANVQVLRDGRVKLLDFGTAHLVDPLERITQEGDFVGTFSYAAPEQIVGSRIDHRADLYAFGVLLFRLLTGRRPFRASDPHKVAHMHLHVDPPKLRDLVSDLPEELEELVSWLLQKQRRDRPQRADEIAARLEQISGVSLSTRGQALTLYDDLSVGRATEHRDAWAWIEAAEGPSVYVVHGGDPLERQRFVDQLERDAAKRGFAAGRADVTDPGPGALARALAALVAPGTAEGESLQRTLGGFEGLAEHLWVPTLARLGPDVLEGVSAREEVALVLLDEVGARDAGTVQALARLLRVAAERGLGLQVVATSGRADDGGLSLLRQSGAATTDLHLGHLDARRTGLAVGALLHRRPPPPDTARQLQRATGGHPTLLADVLRRMIADGELRVRDDDVNRVDWADEARHSVPEPVRDALERRLGTLPATFRRILEVLDTVGGLATPAHLATATDLRPDDLTGVLEAMVEDGLVRIDDGEVHPVDHLVMAFVGAQMRPVRRAATQHVVSMLVQDEPPNPAHIPLLLAVGKTALALERAMICARAAQAEGAPQEALDLLEQVVSHADDPVLPVDARIDHHLAFADALQRVRPMDARAVRSIDAAWRLAEGTDRAPEVLVGRAEQQRGIGHYANHRKYLIDAWNMVERGPATPLKARIAMELGHSFDYAAQGPQATSWFDTALETARAVDDTDLAGHARVGLAALQLAQGDADAALDAVEPLLDDPDVDDVVRWHAAAVWGHTQRRLGRFSDALPRLRAAMREARDGQSVPAWAAVTLAAASAELDLFRLGGAQELIEELASAIGAGERLHLRLETRLFQGRLELASGQPVTANFLLDEVVTQAEKAGLVLIAELGRAYLAEARWALGARDEAKMLYQKALLGLMGTSNLGALADAIVSRARAVGDTEDPTKAFRLVRKLLERTGHVPLQIEHLLAETRWFRAQGDEHLVKQSLREAQTAMNRLASWQTDIEQATLRVHPWMHEVTIATQGA